MSNFAEKTLHGSKSLKNKKIRGEFWTSGQRKGCALHEISYRACFKPQVPRFFIERYSRPGDIVYDPFMGRGTTILEAVLCGREAIGNDVNPLSTILVEPRLSIASLDAIRARLWSLSLEGLEQAETDLSMFYHPQTLSELLGLRRYLSKRKMAGEEDQIDRWIRMVATNRLTGHSAGFFSVYTLPPNQAASQRDQERINKSRKQTPPYRNVRELIYRKSRRMISALRAEEAQSLSDSLDRVILMTNDARQTSSIMSNSVQLTVTSPPFLDIVDYVKDNWLRCWFNEIPVEQIEGGITRTRTLDSWRDVMSGVFKELFRITKPKGFVAFEVGEVRKKTIHLDEVVAPMGELAGFRAVKTLINTQHFTKTAHIWGVQNNLGGTNTNRVVLFQKKLTGKR